MQTWDLVIIGGGPAGEAAAMEAIALGARVALVEQRGRYGGTCRYAGCVPSKTLLHSAEVLHMMQHHAKAIGLPPVNPDWDFRAVLRHKDDVILRAGGEDGYDVPRSFRDAGGQTFTGTAHFHDPHTLNVAGELLTGEQFVIATGSRPRVPSIPGLAEAGYLTWEGIFDLPTVPEALAIIGGGPLGIELSQAFHRFGSRVTVWEAEDMIIPQADSDAVKVLQAALEAEGVEFQLSTQIKQVRRERERRIIIAARDGDRREDTVTHILVAAGQEPNTDTLDLDQARVKCKQDGSIEVDDYLRTSAPHIYACGDVIGGYQLAHVAEYEGKLAVGNALSRTQQRSDQRVVPWVVFTSPPLAHIGMLESEASAQQIPFVVAQLPVSSVERALLVEMQTGCIKALAHRHTGELLGVEIVSYGADDLIHEAALALKLHASVHDIADVIHAFPTFSQGLGLIATELVGKLDSR